MKTSTKIFIGLVGILAVATYFGYKKFQKLQDFFNNIGIQLLGVKDIKFTSHFVEFKANVKLVNNTNEDFSITGYFVKLKDLNFFYKGKYIGKAMPNLVEISVPKHNELIIQDIPANIPLNAIFTNLAEITTFNANNLTVEAVVTVAGKDYLIKS